MTTRREAGQRGTRQRRAICRVLEEAVGPLSPQDVHRAARAQVPDLGIATVYRALKELEDAGWLESVAVAGLATRYECAGRNHHHHFRCDGCDRLFDLSGCTHAIDLGLSTPPGFVVSGHEVVIHGLCRDCVASG